MDEIDEAMLSFALGKILRLTLLGHRHNCGEGPTPYDCSRLDAIAAAIACLASNPPRVKPNG